MIPSCTYVYSAPDLSELKPIRDMANKRVSFYTGRGGRAAIPTRMGVPIEGAPGRERLVVAASGDFCITSAYHQFVLAAGYFRKSPRPFAYVHTSLLPPKHIIRYLFSPTIELSALMAELWRGDVISVRDGRIHKLLFRLFLKRTKFRLNVHKAHLLRSAIEAFGYNLVCTHVFPEVEAGVFKIAWRRRKVAALVEEYTLRQHSDHLFRFAPDNPRGWYCVAGFLHVGI